MKNVICLLKATAKLIKRDDAMYEKHFHQFIRIKQQYHWVADKAKRPHAS